MPKVRSRHCSALPKYQSVGGGWQAREREREREREKERGCGRLTLVAALHLQNRKDTNYPDPFNGVKVSLPVTVEREQEREGEGLICRCDRRCSILG